jgi:hypothetical protein
VLHGDHVQRFEEELKVAVGHVYKSERGANGAAGARAFDGKVESMMWIPKTARIRFNIPTGTRGQS